VGRKLGRSHSLSGRFLEEKYLLLLPGIELLVFQLIASQNTDYAIPASCVTRGITFFGIAVSVLFYLCESDQ